MKKQQVAVKPHLMEEEPPSIPPSIPPPPTPHCTPNPQFPGLSSQPTLHSVGTSTPNPC